MYHSSSDNSELAKRRKTETAAGLESSLCVPAVTGSLMCAHSQHDDIFAEVEIFSSKPWRSGRGWQRWRPLYLLEMANRGHAHYGAAEGDRQRPGARLKPDRREPRLLYEAWSVGRTGPIFHDTPSRCTVRAPSHRIFMDTTPFRCRAGHQCMQTTSLHFLASPPEP